jgi:hypothetical protein
MDYSWPQGACSGNGDDPGGFCPVSKYIPLPVKIIGSKAIYELCIATNQANVEADNGPYGAGSLVIKGYFSVLVNSLPSGAPSSNFVNSGVIPVALIGSDSYFMP